jgi:hypothetical protein
VTSQVKKREGQLSHVHWSRDKEIDGQCRLIMVKAETLHLPAHYSCGQGFSARHILFTWLFCDWGRRSQVFYFLSIQLQEQIKYKNVEKIKANPGKMDSFLL